MKKLVYFGLPNLMSGYMSRPFVSRDKGPYLGSVTGVVQSFVTEGPSSEEGNTERTLKRKTVTRDSNL